MSSNKLQRSSVMVDGVPASFLTAEADGPLVLMLHGTYWSRVWSPIILELAAFGLRPVAVDFRGLGLSDGELTLSTATVPELADWAEEFVAALGVDGPIGVVGHDIGGAVAQHLLVQGGLNIGRFALVNSVTFDSWPVPGVARFRDPEVVDAMSEEEMLASRRMAITAALGDAASEDLIQEYLQPWKRRSVRRSWMSLAGAADSRYTLSIVPELQTSSIPKLLVWGEDDQFQSVEYAERFVAQVPNSGLVRIPGAGHIPMENSPGAVALALGNFFSDGFRNLNPIR
jgi:pimeloyl-ACP methyl ester carboxylesterase